jgi:amino acid transporter
MSSASLSRTLSAPLFFAISFASVVGVSWVVVLGEWLRLAGPVGATIAFLAAGAVMMLVGLCYAEICTFIPAAGGEMAYAFAAFGIRSSFAVGWLLALVYVSATAFEGLSVGWLAGILFPPLAGRTLYHVYGMPVGAGALALGVGGTLVLTALNARGMRSSGRFQSAITWVKVGVAVVLVGSGLIWGHVGSLHPWFAGGAARAGAVHGTIAVLVTAPFWLAGFNTVVQLMEERAPGTSPTGIVVALLASIGAAAAFYALLILSAAMAMPWEEITKLPFPAIGAFAAALHSEIAARVVLLAGLVGLLATWNALFIASSRLLFALARAGMIHHDLAHVGARSGVPINSVLFVGAFSGACILLGRSALLPIISVDSGCIMLVYAVVAFAVVRMRRLDPDRPRPYRMPGGVITATLAMLAALFMFAESMYLAWESRVASVPVEWQILLGWTLLGLLGWALAAPARAALSVAEQRRLIMGGIV